MARFQSNYSGAEMDDVYNRVLGGTAGIQGVKVNGLAITPDQSNKVNISVPTVSSGDFTPILSCWTNAGTPSNPQCSYEVQYGHYYKIGRLCHFTVKIKAISFTSTGYRYIGVSGLYFTSDTSSSNQEHCVSVGEYSCINMDNSLRSVPPMITAYIRNNSSQIRFRQNNGSNAIDFGNQELPKELYISVAGVYLCQN